MPVRRATLTATLAVAAAALPAGSASAAGILQPGALVETDTGRCTLNFAYTGTGADNKGEVYVGTAAHCVEGVGQQARDADGEAFGTVALQGDPAVNAEDYAFIKVDPEDRSRVLAQVKGNASYPTGVTTAGETSFGDTLQASGFGLIFDSLPLLRERRIGLLSSDTATEYRAIAPVLFGDSGGPIVHTRTGKALGIVSRLCVGSLCTVEGPTVEGALAKAAARGLSLQIRT